MNKETQQPLLSNSKGGVYTSSPYQKDDTENQGKLTIELDAIENEEKPLSIKDDLKKYPQKKTKELKTSSPRDNYLENLKLSVTELENKGISQQHFERLYHKEYQTISLGIGGVYDISWLKWCTIDQLVEKISQRLFLCSTEHERFFGFTGRCTESKTNPKNAATSLLQASDSKQNSSSKEEKSPNTDQSDRASDEGVQELKVTANSEWFTKNRLPVIRELSDFPTSPAQNPLSQSQRFCRASKTA